MNKNLYEYIMDIYRGILWNIYKDAMNRNKINTINTFKFLSIYSRVNNRILYRFDH